MIINTKKALAYFEFIIELPIWGTALYLKMSEYMDVISTDIDEFKNLSDLRDMVKNKTKKWPKSSDFIKFEVVNIDDKLWVPVLTEKKDSKPSEILPGKLVDFIVEKSTIGIIQKKNNLIVPGFKEKVVDLWFEKISDDYIYGIIKWTELPLEKIEHNIDFNQAINDLKNVDFDEMNAVFRHIFESSDFRNRILSEYRKIWKGLNDKIIKQG
ncbi:MAG: hypothetical protein PVH61_36600 [Candidatus Aminicenantes bacterium]|jgi:hypothetical protein